MTLNKETNEIYFIDFEYLKMRATEIFKYFEFSFKFFLQPFEYFEHFI